MQVDEQVDHQHGDPHHEEHARDDRVVAREHGVQKQRAHAGQQENLLQNHRAADQQRSLQADQRDDGDQAVAQGVAEDHGALAQALARAVRT
jgi:hypothetical protein